MRRVESSRPRCVRSVCCGGLGFLQDVLGFLHAEDDTAEPRSRSTVCGLDWDEAGGMSMMKSAVAGYCIDKYWEGVTRQRLMAAAASPCGLTPLRYVFWEKKRTIRWGGAG